MLILTITLVTLLTILIYVGARIYYNYSKVSHIPGGWQVMSFFWQIPFFSEYMFVNNHHAIVDLIQKKGDPKNGIARISLMDRNLVYITNREMLKEIVITKGSNFPKYFRPYEVFKTFGDNLLTILDGNSENWRNHHKICSPAFTSQNLEYLCEYSSESADMLFSTLWEKNIQSMEINGKSVKGYFTKDIKSDFSDITLDVLGRVGFDLDFDIFGKKSESNGSIFRKSLEKLFTTGVYLKLFIGMSTFFKWAYPLSQELFGVRKAFDIVSSKLDSIIKERKQEIENQVVNSGERLNRRDLLSCLLEANYVQKGILTDSEIKSDAFIFSLAGHETTSTTLQWICYELGKRPEIQQRAREEVDIILGVGESRRKPTYDDFNKMNYLNQCIMEALRLHPPVLASFRVAKKTTNVGKYNIPKGTIVAIDLYGSHVIEDNWKEPNDFNPERFSSDFEERQKVHTDFKWIPFSMGNRKCIGYKFAQYEAFTVLSRLLQFYEIITLNNESNPLEKVTEVPGPTVGPGNLILFFKKRNSNE